MAQREKVTKQIIALGWIGAAGLIAALAPGPSSAQRTAGGEDSPADHLPPHIRQLTHFGERHLPL
jgi:hypothetical protein